MTVIDKKMIALSFGKAAGTYDSVAHFQRWAGLSLLDKIPLTDARVVLDMGCGTGYFGPSLAERFPGAAYIGLDLSEQMLRYARSQHPEQNAWLAGDAENLPLKEHTVDLVYSSLAIQWCADLPGLMAEVNRVLKPGGLFVFSSLLDGTLCELKRAWAEVDTRQHVNNFFLKERYHSAAAEAGFQLRLLEQEKHVLRYQKVTELMRELKALGAHNLNADRASALTGRSRLLSLINAYECFRDHDGLLPASYQLIWGVLEKRPYKN